MFTRTKKSFAGLAIISVLLASGCSGGGGGDSPPPNPGSVVTPPPAPPPPSSEQIASNEQATRFLTAASFGPSSGEANQLSGSSAIDWIENQARLPATLYLSDVLAATDSEGKIIKDIDSDLYWNKAILADDQLRQRMVFALSQIIVISDSVVQKREYQNQFAYYRDILSQNALGNYRNLMEEITYSPVMAEWLTYMQNQKGDPETGRMPDENYARELLQLFTIGLVELNLDGTPRLDGSGSEIETFNNEDVVGLARVFTGLSYNADRFNRSISKVPFDSLHSPMIVYPDEHSQLEKRFLGSSIPAGTSGETSIEMALDTIFEHPNVGPFLARQLIQRFTASNPEPEYVARVATAFNNGRFQASDGTVFGTGERGDLLATISAVLLDESLYDPNRTLSPSDGKIQEPILRFVHWARAFNVQNVDAINQRRLSDTSNPLEGFGQHPFRSPSVFNFYRPGYIAPGTESGSRDVTAPEFQIVNSSSQFGTFNSLSEFAFGEVPSGNDLPDNFVPDYSVELPLAYDVPALIEHLDEKLAGGRLSTNEIEEISAVIDLMDARTDTEEREQNDRFDRVAMAVSLVLASPNYILLRQFPDNP